MTKTSKKDRLKLLADKKRIINERQREIKADIAVSKKSRLAARELQADQRIAILGAKKELRELIANIASNIKEGDSKTQSGLADALVSSASDLAAVLREFAEATKVIETT